MRSSNYWMFNLVTTFNKMLNVYVVKPTRIDFNKMRDGEKTLLESFQGKIVSNKALPQIKLRTKPKSLDVTIPQTIVAKFSHILGVHNERAKELYELGARNLDSLLKNHKKYKLSLTELNGCIYFDQLITPITDENERRWGEHFHKSFLKLNCHVVSSNVWSRPNGIHSRMEVMICVTSECSVLMDEYLEIVKGGLPDGGDSVFERYVDHDSDSSLCRIRAIYSFTLEECFILDITIYRPEFHPYPLLRCLRETYESTGYHLSDFGIDGPNGPLSGRELFGRDNLLSKEEIDQVIQRK